MHTQGPLKLSLVLLCVTKLMCPWTERHDGKAGSHARRGDLLGSQNQHLPKATESMKPSLGTYSALFGESCTESWAHKKI
jgi:hypothetical protein